MLQACKMSAENWMEDESLTNEEVKLWLSVEHDAVQLVIQKKLKLFEPPADCWIGWLLCGA
jgi:hypothetical protein